MEGAEPQAASGLQPVPASSLLPLYRTPPRFASLAGLGTADNPYIVTPHTSVRLPAGCYAVGRRCCVTGRDVTVRLHDSVANLSYSLIEGANNVAAGDFNTVEAADTWIIGQGCVGPDNRRIYLPVKPRDVVCFGWRDKDPAIEAGVWEDISGWVLNYVRPDAAREIVVFMFRDVMVPFVPTCKSIFSLAGVQNGVRPQGPLRPPRALNGLSGSTGGLLLGGTVTRDIDVTPTTGETAHKRQRESSGEIA